MIQVVQAEVSREKPRVIRKRLGRGLSACQRVLVCSNRPASPFLAKQCTFLGERSIARSILQASTLSNDANEYPSLYPESFQYPILDFRPS